MGAFVYNSQDGMVGRYTSNGGYYVTGTALNDTIVNGGYYDSSNYYSLQADHLHRGDNVNINGWEGSDKILNHGDKVYIGGGSDDDSIRNHFGKYVTICGNEGDDTIICQGEGLELIEYAPGDGNDIIYNFFDEKGQGTPEDSDYECIYIGSGDVSDTSKVDDSYFDGSDFVLKIGNGSITLKDAKGKRFEIQDNYNNGGRGIYTKVKVLKDSSDTTPSPDDTLSHDDNVIYGTPNDDMLETDRDNVRVYALDGNDTISNGVYGHHVTINGGDGDDSISNNSLGNVTINGGAGNDVINNHGSSVSIDAGDGSDNIGNMLGHATIEGGRGNDYILNTGRNDVIINGGDDNDTIVNFAQSHTIENATIIGGKGNDSIVNMKTYDYDYSALFVYNAGDGSDTINGFNATSTLSISGGSYSSLISGNDVIITVGDGSITLKDATITSDNIIFTHKDNPDNPGNPDNPDNPGNPDNPDNPGNPDNPDNLADNTKSYWTLDDLRVFLDAFNQFKSIVKLREIFDISARIIDIFESVIDIVKKDKTGTDFTGKLTEIVGDIVDIIGDVKSLKGKDDLFWSLAASGLGCLGSFIATLDVEDLASTEAGKKELREKFDNLAKETADLANESVETTIKSLGKLSSISQAEASALAKQARLKANAMVSVLMAGYTGFVQYQESVEKYSAEELPLSMIAGETFIDAIAAGLHGGAHQYTYGLDDLAFKGLRWVFSLGKASDTDKNYMEWIAEGIKYITFGSTSAGDTIEIDHDGQPLNAQAGDDYIRNVFSHVRIYGERGNDTIFSHQGARRNYLHGGSGRDYIIANDTESTVIGSSENDKLMSTGEGNSLSGGNGIDFILLENASENTVNGGTSDDIISIGNSKKTIIYYAEGDGNDIIFGYDEDDTIHIAGKTKYTVTENGQHINIKVGNNVIILYEAIGKNIKIENRDTADNPIDDINPFEANPIISNTLSRISARETENVVTDINSLNDLTENGTSILTFTENSGRGIQNVNLSSSEYPQVVSLEGGNQNVQFNDQNGNVAIVGNNATGWKDIIFGNGNNLGVFFSPKAKINTTLGSGRDSVIIDNNAKVIVDMSNSEETKIVPYSGSVTLDNYDALTGAAIQTEVNDLAKAIKEGSIQLIGNEVQLNPASSVIIKDAFDDSTLVNLIASDDTVQTVWFTGNKLGSIDAKELEGDLLLKSSYITKSSDLQKIKPSTLISGKGNDTIFAGARAFVDAGAGDNLIYLTSSRLRQNKRGATIASVEEGQTTVYGFNTGFEKTSDVLFFDKVDATDFNFDGTNLIVSNDKGAKTTLSNVAKDTPFVQILVADETGLLKTDIAKETATITVDDLSANAYIGKNSGVDFSNVTKTLLVNLSESIDNSNTSELMFEGITQVTAGGGYSSLIGSEANETLSAGTGNTSIWSGGGNDSMVGMGDSTDKKGRITFFFLAGDGYDTIDNFTFLTPENSSSNLDDKIDITADNEVTNVRIAGNDVVVQINGSNDYLTLKEAVGKDFRINDRIAKVDQNIAYDSLANCYVASGGSSLTVDSSVDSAEIWLDNSRGTLFLGKIFTLDASAVKGNTSLVGNDFNNTIIAGQGDSSLWGGSSSSNDLLIGGKSQNTFFYFMDNGRDTIQGANNGDKVILDNISLDQIISTNITADAVFINFNDGGSLKVDGQSDVTYQLADGSKYSASYERLQWDSK